MESQVEAMIPHLKVGSSYLFEHTRKGPFVATFSGTVPTGEGDEADAIFLELDVYTEDGSGQERLANSFRRNEQGNKVRPPVSRKLVRPSLLQSITAPSVDEQHRLMSQYTRARELPVAPSQSLPTAQGLAHIGAPADQKASAGWWKKLTGWMKEE